MTLSTCICANANKLLTPHAGFGAVSPSFLFVAGVIFFILPLRDEFGNFTLGLIRSCW